MCAFFLILMSIMYVDVISRVHPAGRLSCLAKLLMMDITRKLFNQIFFILDMLIGTIDFYHLRPHFSHLDFTWGSQGQHKAIPPGFNFSHTFQLIRIKFYMVIFEQFKLNTLAFLVEVMSNKGNNYHFTDCGMHSDFCRFGSNLV